MSPPRKPQWEQVCILGLERLRAWLKYNDSGPGSNEAPQSAGCDFLENLQVNPELPEVPEDLPYVLWPFHVFVENQFLIFFSANKVIFF